MKTILLFLSCFTISTIFSQGLSLPYYTGFDSPAEQAGWQQFRTGFLSNFDWDDNGELYHDYNVGGISTDTVIDWYVSPPLNLTSTSLVTMKVQTSGFSTPTVDNCEIWFGTKDPNPETGNFVLIANLSYMLPQFQWLDTMVTISTVTDSGYIAFKYKTIGGAWANYRIDSINVTTTVGLNDLKNADRHSLSIFPNPAKDKIQLRSINEEQKDWKGQPYKILNEQGKLMRTATYNGWNINITDLTPGHYFLIIESEQEESLTSKFQVIRQ